MLYQIFNILMLYQIFNIVPNVTVPDSYLTCTDTKCELCANLCLLFQKKLTDNNSSVGPFLQTHREQIEEDLKDLLQKILKM